MKRIVFLFLIAVTCMNLQAQNKLNLKGISSITNYGIDYTLAKVLGGNESAHQYWCTYADINELFIEKPNIRTSHCGI